MGYSAAATRLLNLCENGELEETLCLLQDKTILQIVLGKEIVTVPSTWGRTESHLVFERMINATVKHRHLNLLNALLDFGVDHGVPAPFMVTKDVVDSALWGPPAEGALKYLLALQRVEPDVFSMRLTFGYTILQLAAKCGCKGKPCVSLPLVRHMLDIGFPMNFVHFDQPGTLLKDAVHSGCYDMVELLLQRGAAVKDSGAQEVAAFDGYVRVLELLVRYGVDLNEYSPASWEHEGGPALHSAIRAGQTEAVRWLLENGADVTLMYKGKLPKDCVPRENGEEIALLLSSS